jgi:hypothetical protein
MDLVLRRLPDSMPSPQVRERVLGHAAPAIRSMSARVSLVSVGAAAVLAVAIGVMFAGSSVLNGGASASPDFAAAARVGGPATASAVAALPSDLEQSDVLFLQEIGGTVGKTGFRPMMPLYLPRGWHLDLVKIGRMQPAGPIDQVEIAFGSNGKQLHMWQSRGPAADAQQGQFPPGQWQTARSVLVNGHEWHYLTTAVVEGAEPTGVLVGQRDGVTIWLESSLPVDEMTRVAASLRN